MITETSEQDLLRLTFSKAPEKVGIFLPHQRTETELVSEMCFLAFKEFRTMDKVQKPGDFEHTFLICKFSEPSKWTLVSSEMLASHPRR
jgi:hypothetical protein